MFFLLFSILSIAATVQWVSGNAQIQSSFWEKMQNYSKVHRNDYTANPASSSGVSFSAD